jgi:hypothetical protein
VHNCQTPVLRQQLFANPLANRTCRCAQDFGLIRFSIVLVLSETVLVLVIESRQLMNRAMSFDLKCSLWRIVAMLSSDGDEIRLV